jgi:tetratricopeptide (TPR) repeat protein
MSNNSNNYEDTVSRHPGKKPLWQFYNLITQYEYTDHVQAREIFDQTMEHFAEFTAAPDMWHNTAMVAGRVEHYDAKLKLIQEGLKEWPKNTDLLCDALQERITYSYDEERAAEIWEQLDGMPREKTSSYWRFWVFGALYFSRVLGKRQKALELLDDGLCSVKRDSLMDIIRNYRRILIDSAPEEPLETSEIEQFQKRALDELEKRYLLGIRLGVENGHVLAILLAQLSRERAGEGLGEAVSPGEVQPARGHLEQALRYLDLAESLYTGIGGENHPVWEIYEERARVLMAMNEYEEALYLIQSLPQSRQNEMSLSAMMKFATFKTGLQLEIKEEPVSLQEAFRQVVPALFDNSGELLLELVRDDPAKQQVLMQVIYQLQSEQGE